MEVIRKYFKAPDHPSCYALYAVGQDRFLMHTAVDHWSLLDTAKVLSSKLATVLCFSVSEPFPFKNEDCLQWTLRNKKVSLSKFQTPTIHHINSSADLEFKGSFSEPENEFFIKDHNFANFISKSVIAARHVDLNMSLIPELHNEDQNFYLKLVLNKNDEGLLRARNDQTIWEKGFLNTIYTILYLSENETEIINKIKNLKFEIDHCEDRIAAHISYAYLKMFSEYLE